MVKNKIFNRLLKSAGFIKVHNEKYIIVKAFESAANAVVITDIRGKILWVNESYLKVTGYKRDEVVDNYIDVLLNSERYDEEFYKNILNKLLTDGIWRGILVYEKKDGTLYPEEQTITPFRDEKGEVTGFISVQIDIKEKTGIEQDQTESRKRLELFFRQSPDGFFFMILDEPVKWDENSDKETLLDYIFAHLKITHVNQALIVQSGGTFEEYIGLTPSDIYKHNIPEGRRVWKDFFDSGIKHIETIARKFDGTPFYIEGDYFVIYDNYGRILGSFGIHRDITLRKKNEEALKQKSEEMERFFTVTLDLLCIIDTEGYFIRVNREWERILGYSMDELEGRSFMEFVHPDDIQSTNRFLEALTDQVPVLNFTNRYRNSEGNYRFIEWRSYPTGKYIYTAARDITERINYELELNKLAERLTLATESAGMGIWDWDIVNNVIIWDSQMYNLYGIKEDVTEGLYGLWEKKIHPDDRKSIVSFFSSGVKELSTFKGSFRIIWPDGTIHYLEGHAQVIRGLDGKAERITGVTRDITESKKMEEKLVALSTTDPLTCAYNRRYLLIVLESEINRAVRYNAVFSLIMFDLDHFKHINDNFGHDAGDEILKKIVAMMNRRIRRNDVLARWGGEEFMILLPGTGLDSAGIFADKLINEVRNMSFSLSGNITASFGVTEYRRNETSDSVLKRVDELVYLAKNEGRNCVRAS